jgi:glycogen synthase
MKNKTDYDIVHAFDFDTGFIAAKCAKKLGKRFVYHILDYYVDSHGLRKTALEKAVINLENSAG